MLTGLSVPMLAPTAGAPAEADYISKYTDKNSYIKAGSALNDQICDEGFTLLKNLDGFLPMAGAEKISVFGKNSVNLVYGGSGSGGVTADEYTKDLYDSLEAAGFQTNPELKKFYKDNGRSGSGRAENPDMNSGGVPGFDTGETPVSSYDSAVKGSYASYNDAALIVLSRIGGEGADLPRTSLDQNGNKIAGARNADDHYLQLDQNETDLIKEVCNGGFKHVVVLINSASVLECGFLDDDFTSIKDDYYNQDNSIKDPQNNPVMNCYPAKKNPQDLSIKLFVYYSKFFEIKHLINSNNNNCNYLNNC